MKGTIKKIASQKWGFLNFGPTYLPLIKSLPTPFDKSALSPLGVTVARSTADAAIQKKIYDFKTKVEF